MSVPTSLVEAGVRRYGHFDAPFSNANPLDEFSGLTRALRGIRLKEWAGFTLLHRDWYSAMIIQDAKYLASSEIYFYDAHNGALHEHAAQKLGGYLGLPKDFSESQWAFRGRGFEVAYDISCSRGYHTLRFDIAATAKAAAFKGELKLDARNASPPLVVSATLQGGSMYTHKTIFPVSGELHIGEQRVVFDPARDMALLDEHKSSFPYHTRWQWGTFAMPVDGGYVAANFSDDSVLPGHGAENHVWTPTSCEPFSGVKFEPESNDPMTRWHVFTPDGRLDVVFEPIGYKPVKHQLVLFAIDYLQRYGSYTGTVRSTDGRSWEIKSAHGVLENMRARM